MMCRISFLLSAFILSHAAWAKDVSLGDIADNIMGPMALLERMIVLAAYLIGISLIIGGIMQFQIWRQNPKIAPITRVVMYFVLGIFVIVLPTMSKTLSLVRPTSAIEVQDKKSHGAIYKRWQDKVQKHERTRAGS